MAHSLTLTENAVVAVKMFVESSPDVSGLRISAHDGGITSYQVHGAALPAADDDVVEQDGARVFLDESVSGALEGKALDAEIDDDRQIAFILFDA
jgi:iron-sulfur cluster assembly protein